MRRAILAMRLGIVAALVIQVRSDTRHDIAAAGPFLEGAAHRVRGRQGGKGPQRGRARGRLGRHVPRQARRPRHREGEQRQQAEALQSPKHGLPWASAPGAAADPPPIPAPGWGAVPTDP